MTDPNAQPPEDDSASDASQPVADDKPEDQAESSDQTESADSSEQPEALTPSADESSESADSSSDSGEAKPDDDLPEWEPLTPEDIEDEAIRGDFMLRWLVVLLAFLLGCREIGETMTLVRVRTGEAIAANGFWPPSTDVFSYSAAERPWVNPAWLFDLILSAVWNIGGAVGLSLLTALLAAVTFYLLVHISRDKLPTWWTAVCAAVALLMAQSQFTALPELITLLGTVWVLRGLVAWSESNDSKVLWCLVASLAVWSNLDPRAFIGWLIFAAFAAGTFLTRKSATATEPSAIRDLGKAVGLGLVALMINPMGWHALLSPLQMYGFDIPTQLSYVGAIDSPAEAQLLSLLDSRFADALSLASIAALALAGIVLLSCIANLKSLDTGLVGAFIVAVVLALICSHELGVVAVTASVLAALNGQDWYRERCRQEYTTDTWEVLWSRAGRAITVLSLAAVAWLAISGRMMGRDGRRVGIGFASWLQAAIDGTAEDLEEIPDERLFVLRLEHGDLLVWHNRPTFIDSRVGLYGEEIVRLHDQARHGLRSRLDGSRPAAATAASPQTRDRVKWRGQRELWEQTFEQFDVGLVTPRLWGASPDYESLFDLLSSGDWSMASLGSTLAALQRSDAADAEPVDFVKLAFENCRTQESADQRVEFPRARSGYQQFLSLPSRKWTPVAIRANHQRRLAAAGFAGQVSLSKADVMALAVMALRDASVGAVHSPGNDSVYRTMADAHSALGVIESQAIGPQAEIVASQRYYLRVHFLRQALTLAPDDPLLLSTLAQEYFTAKRWDLTLEMIDRFLTAVGGNADVRKQFAPIVRQFQSVRPNLLQQKATLEQQLAPAIQDKSVDMVPIAAGLRAQGYPLRALRLLEEHRLGLAGRVEGQVEHGLALIECGRLTEAADHLASMDALGDAPGIPLLWTLQAAWLDLARGDHARALVRCEQKLRQMEVSSIQAMLSVAPFVQPMPQFLSGGNTWPVSQAVLAGSVFRARDEVAFLRWTAACAYLESGDCQKATDALTTLIESEPESPLRPLAVTYLDLLTGETIPAEPPSERVPVLFVDGPEDPEPPTPVEEESPSPAPESADP